MILGVSCQDGEGVARLNRTPGTAGQATASHQTASRDVGFGGTSAEESSAMKNEN